MKGFFLLFGFILFLPINNVHSQNDTLYVMKAGVIINKQSIKAEDVDSLIFYKPTVYVDQTINGKVILPKGTSIDLSELSVQSFIDNSSIISDTYSIQIPKDQPNFTFVTDNNDKVILMGYNYPNQINYDLSAESTVIALAMGLPITTNLTTEGKIDFVNKMKSNANFSTAVEKMELLISQGNSPLDTEQTEFLNSFLMLFESTATSKRADSKLDYDRDPVKILKAGNLISFQNVGTTYETTIGIYKDGQRIDYFELGRIKFLVSSISEAIRIANNLATNSLEGIKVIEKDYEFKEDGDYEIKIRTGLNQIDFSSENQQAVINNLGNWTMDILFTVLPLEGKPECILTLSKEIKKYVELAKNGLPLNTLADVMSASYNIAYSFINLGDLTAKCYASSPENWEYFVSAKKFLKYFDWLGKGGAYGNLSISIGQWLIDKPSMDLCYRKNGNETNKCSISLVGSTFNQVSWRFQPVPGIVDTNITSCTNEPYLTYQGKVTLHFDSENTYTKSVYNEDGSLAWSLPYNYSLGAYYSDSLFFGQGPGANCTNSYGHQYDEGWGMKLPPGYVLNFGEYAPSRVSEDGQQIYRLQTGDDVYAKQ
ncbi:hypothetical protein [Mariniflexile sp.]|uniref:hypothetical protein n=1 Tax=Mariniflexile sp. TaxID=1979402 RepID=UPI0040475C59